MKYNFVKLLLGGGITDTSNSGAFNRTDVNKSYLDIYKEMLADPEFNLDAYNDFLGKYYALRTGSGFDQSSGKAQEYDGVKQYLIDFNNYGFHTDPFMQGWQHSSTAYTGDNFDSGAWDPTKNADNWFGSTTAQRYANSWNDEELALANADAKQHGLEWVLDERANGIDTGDGRKFYKLQRIGEPALEIKGEETIKAPELEQGVTPQGSNTPLEFNNQNPPEKTPWTDWIPLSSQLANNLMSAWRQYNYLSKMRFPLMEGPFLQHKITNNYHLRTGMELNANELRGLTAFRSNSSDLRLNMDNMFKADALATDIKNQAEQEKANKYAQETQIAENVTNTNKETEALVANYNTKLNTAAWNNILDAKSRYDLRRTEALNSWIGNMYTSHGEWLKDMRLNDLAYQRGLNAYDASLKQQEAYLKYQDLTSDFSKSQAFADFWDAVKLPGADILLDSAADYENVDKVKALWAGNSDLAKEYRAKWEDEKNNALNNLYLQNLQIGNNLSAKNLLFPAIVNNQGIYYNPYRKTNISPIFRGAKGGSVRARYIDYANHVLRELQKQKELLHKRNELSQKRLIADLDRLSRELSILLRSVFK